MMKEDFWEDLYQIDAADAWINSGYDEQGEAILCDACKEEIRFDEETRGWVCPGCGQTISRAKWFGYIGANPPGPKCLTQCGENYPLCKRWCTFYEIGLDDPMM